MNNKHNCTRIIKSGDCPISPEHEDILKVSEPYYEMLRVLPDSRIIGVIKLMFHYSLHVDIGMNTVTERYCFETKNLATDALMSWNGAGEPIGWHRHPETRRRRDVATGREWVES